MQNIFSYANTYEDAGIDVTVSMSSTIKGGPDIAKIGSPTRPPTPQFWDSGGFDDDKCYNR